MARLFGEDFSGVRVRFGGLDIDARGAAEGETVTFARPNPTRDNGLATREEVIAAMLEPSALLWLRPRAPRHRR